MPNAVILVCNHCWPFWQLENRRAGMQIEVTGTCESNFLMFSAMKVGNITPECWNSLGYRDSIKQRCVCFFMGLFLFCQNFLPNFPYWGLIFSHFTPLFYLRYNKTFQVCSETQVLTGAFSYPYVIYFWWRLKSQPWVPKGQSMDEGSFSFW